MTHPLQHPHAPVGQAASPPPGRDLPINDPPPSDGSQPPVQDPPVPDPDPNPAVRQEQPAEPDEAIDSSWPDDLNPEAHESAV